MVGQLSPHGRRQGRRPLAMAVLLPISRRVPGVCPLVICQTTISIRSASGPLPASHGRVMTNLPAGARALPASRGSGSSVGPPGGEPDRRTISPLSSLRACSGAGPGRLGHAGQIADTHRDHHLGDMVYSRSHPRTEEGRGHVCPLLDQLVGPVLMGAGGGHGPSSRLP